LIGQAPAPMMKPPTATRRIPSAVSISLFSP
jgi:hypothetical protein